MLRSSSCTGKTVSFSLNSGYVKHMKTRTRLTKSENKPGVTVYVNNHNGAPVPMNYGE